MNRLSCALSVILLLALSGICTTVAVAQEAPLTNADLVKLTKLEMGDAVIIAKIKAAKEVQFDTSTDELVKLREAGVSKDVIAAMIERTAPPPANEGGGPDLKVQLQSAEGVVELKALYGTVKTLQTPWAVQSWLQVVDLQAKIRTKDRRPALLLSLDRDPRGGWWFVQLSQFKKENYRYFDQQGGGGLAVTFSGTPEKGSIVPYEVTQEQPGLWRIRPLKDLKPGEYGLFAGSDQFAFSAVSGMFGGYAKGAAGIVFDFGIDK